MRSRRADTDLSILFSAKKGAPRGAEKVQQSLRMHRPRAAEVTILAAGITQIVS